MILIKTCSDCSRELEIDNFRKQASAPDGRAYRCRFCADLAAAERYAKKKQEIILKNSQYQKDNFVAHNQSNTKYSKSVLGRLNRTLNRRLTQLLGEGRESFFHLIGVSASALLVHLAANLPEGMVLEDFGKKWKVQFIKVPTYDEVRNPEINRDFFNWKNLTAKEKILGEKRDLSVK